MRPNPRIEDELFFKNESQTAGINFDKVRNSPPRCFIRDSLFVHSMTIFPLKLVEAAQNRTMSSLLIQLVPNY
jgi:hypothetical protein